MEPRMTTHTASSQPDGYSDSLAEKVIEEIAAVLDLDLAEVRPGCQLRNDFGCQPRDFDMLRWAFEQRWGFFVPINAVAGWKDVGDLISYVEMRLASRG